MGLNLSPQQLVYLYLEEEACRAVKLGISFGTSKQAWADDCVLNITWEAI